MENEKRMGLDLVATKALITTLEDGTQKVEYIVPGGIYNGTKFSVSEDRIKEHKKRIRLEELRIKLLRIGIVGVSAYQGVQLVDSADANNPILFAFSLGTIGVMVAVRSYILGTAMDRLDGAKGRLNGLQIEQSKVPQGLIVEKEVFSSELLRD